MQATAGLLLQRARYSTAAVTPEEGYGPTEGSLCGRIRAYRRIFECQFSATQGENASRTALQRERQGARAREREGERGWGRERDVFNDDRLVRIHFITGMILRTALSLW